MNLTASPKIDTKVDIYAKSNKVYVKSVLLLLLDVGNYFSLRKVKRYKTLKPCTAIRLYVTGNRVIVVSLSNDN